MLKTTYYATIRNNRALGLICEPGIHLHMHWLNPLFLKL